MILYASVASGVLVLLSAIIVTVLVVGLPISLQASSQESAPEISRLEGLADVSIPEYEEEDLWWVSNNESDVPESASEIIDRIANSDYSRVLLSGDVLFAPDESKLTERSNRAIDEIVSTVLDPKADIVVICHSSNDGSISRRLSLSIERANVLADAIELAMQRSPNTFDRVGLGDTSPLQGIDAFTAAGRALNRRCEVFVELKK